MLINAILDYNLLHLINPQLRSKTGLRHALLVLEMIADSKNHDVQRALLDFDRHGVMTTLLSLLSAQMAALRSSESIQDHTSFNRDEFERLRRVCAKLLGAFQQ